MARFLTNSGLAKLAVATPLAPMTVKYMAFDAGQGTPSATMTALFNEVYRTEIPNPVKDPDNPKNLTFTGFVPTTVGGWTIYGVGLFDSLGVLVAYLQLAEPVLKSDPSSALKMSLEQDFIITLANAGETDLIITDSIKFRHDAITHRDLPDSHPMSAITGLDNALAQIQSDIDDKDDQNVKLTGDQTINGLKSFNGNIEVETISNGNASVTLDGANNTVNVTGKLTGDGSGLDAATTAKVGVSQLATGAEAATGTNAVKTLTPSTLRSGLDATGSAPVYAARAFASYNGATGTLEKGKNIASVTKNSVGDYTFNFATAMPDANYAVLISGCRQISATAIDGHRAVYARTTTSFSVKTQNTEDMKQDHELVTAVVFG